MSRGILGDGGGPGPSLVSFDPWKHTGVVTLGGDENVLLSCLIGGVPTVGGNEVDSSRRKGSLSGCRVYGTKVDW